MIGPWIAPSLVLVTSLIMKVINSSKSQQQSIKEIALIQSVGSVGGLVSVGIGFTFPALYFLDKPTFNNLVNNPFWFCSVLAFICFSAGSFGMWIARSLGDSMVNKSDLPFPVSQLVYKTITSQSQTKQAKSMFLGFSMTALLCYLRDGLSIGSKVKFPKILPVKDLFIFQRLFGKEAHISISPMLWAIGFIAGPSIAFPLFIGLLSRYFVLTPINLHSQYLPITLFKPMNFQMLTMAFCSGIILAEILPGLLKYPSMIWNGAKKFFEGDHFKKIKNLDFNFFSNKGDTTNLFDKLEILIGIVLSVIFFSYFKFSILSQILILTLSVMVSYYISYFGAKLGMVQIGRFVTFVMLPAILIFKLSYFQIVLMCVFVGVCVCVVPNVLFNYKIGKMCDISFERMHMYQWLGVVTTSMSIGLFLWLFLSNLQLGSAELFGQRGLNRALLIQSFNFNWTVVFIGFLYGLIIRKLKISPAMVFGGIMMPNSMTIGLSIGALGSLLTQDRQEHFPFFSGVFTSETIWLILSILLRMI